MPQKCLGVLGEPPRPILDDFRLILSNKNLIHTYQETPIKITYVGPYAWILIKRFTYIVWTVSNFGKLSNVFHFCGKISSHRVLCRRRYF